MDKDDRKSPIKTYIKATIQKRRTKNGLTEKFNCPYCSYGGKNKNRVSDHIQQKHQTMTEITSSIQRNELKKWNFQQIVNRFISKQSQKIIVILKSKIIDSITDFVLHQKISQNQQNIALIQATILNKLQQISISLLNKKSYDHQICLKNFQTKINNQLKGKVNPSTWSRIKKGYQTILNIHPLDAKFSFILNHRIMTLSKYEQDCLINYYQKFSNNNQCPHLLNLSSQIQLRKKIVRPVQNLEIEQIKNIIKITYQQCKELAIDIWFIFHLGLRIKPSLIFNLKLNCQKKNNFFGQNNIIQAYLPNSFYLMIQSYQNYQITETRFLKARNYMITKYSSFFSMLALNQLLIMNAFYENCTQQQLARFKQQQNYTFTINSSIVYQLQRLFSIPWIQKKKSYFQLPIVERKYGQFYDVQSNQSFLYCPIRFSLVQNYSIKLLLKDSQLNIYSKLEKQSLKNLESLEQIYLKPFIMTENYSLQSSQALLNPCIFLKFQQYLEFLVRQQQQPITSKQLLQYLEQFGYTNSNYEKSKYFFKYFPKHCFRLIYIQESTNLCAQVVKTQYHSFNNQIQNQKIKNLNIKLKNQNEKIETLYVWSKKNHQQFYFTTENSVNKQNIIIQHPFIYQTHKMSFENNNQRESQICKKKPFCIHHKQGEYFQLQYKQCEKYEHFVMVCKVCNKQLFHNCTSVEEECTVSADGIIWNIIKQGKQFDIKINQQILQYDNNLLQNICLCGNLISSHIPLINNIFLPEIQEKLYERLSQFVLNMSKWPVQIKDGLLISKQNLQKNRAILVLNGIIKTNQNLSIQQYNRSIHIGWLKIKGFFHFQQMRLVQGLDLKSTMSFIKQQKKGNATYDVCIIDNQIQIIVKAKRQIKIKETIILDDF